METDAAKQTLVERTVWGVYKFKNKKKSYVPGNGLAATKSTSLQGDAVWQ